MTRWTVDGTHKGELLGMGIPITGREVSLSGVTVDRFANGKIVETWGVYDEMSMMQQLGVIPQGPRKEKSNTE